MRVHQAIGKILPAELPKQAKSHKTHGARRHSKTSCARAHLMETRSPWDQHTLARDACSQSKSPSSLPLIKGLVSRRGHAEYRGAQLPRYIRLTSLPGSFRSFTLGEWRPCLSSSFHSSKLPLRTCAARSAGDQPHLHALRPILDSPLENSVSPLGLAPSPVIGPRR